MASSNGFCIWPRPNEPRSPPARADEQSLTLDSLHIQYIRVLRRKLCKLLHAGVRSKRLLVRTQLLKLIAAEAARARKGKEAYIILKLNSLEDPGMIAALYEASQAGVRIELLIRGISCLIPELAGQSENIRQRGMVDRFLEHARRRRLRQDPLRTGRRL